MTDTFTFDLVTPEKLVDSSERGMVVVPGVEGDMGVLVGHAPLLSTLRPGVVNLYNEANTNTVDETVFVTGGFVEVTGERCTVLAEGLIDLEETTLEDAKKRLGKAHNSTDIAIAEALVEALS